MTIPCQKRKLKPCEDRLAQGNDKSFRSLKGCQKTASCSFSQNIFAFKDFFEHQDWKGQNYFPYSALEKTLLKIPLKICHFGKHILR